jgi:LPXTG-site transpeptidase (sortase) family protein
VRRTPRNRTKGVILAASATMLTMGLLLTAFSLPLSSESTAGARPHKAQSPAVNGAATAAPLPRRGLPEPTPRDSSMLLSVPEMKRVREVPVETAPARKEAPLRDGALHVEGTGFPWQRGSNVYIVGHRLGFPGTRSHLIFWDLPALGKGDRIILEDSEGRTYEYSVFREIVVSPREVAVTKSLRG